MFKVDGWITYTAALIPAVMNGDKTLTSRVMRPQYAGAVYWKSPAGMFFRDEKPAHRTMIECPYGQPGDILGVKEGYKILAGMGGTRVHGYYLADMSAFDIELSRPEWDRWASRKFPYRATAGMYRSLCRTRLKVLSVKVERLQDITDRDAALEGWPGGELGRRTVLEVSPPTISGNCAREWFILLWNTINNKCGFGWDANPWVWRVGFERIEN